jgi:hypothetical protein
MKHVDTDVIAPLTDELLSAASLRRDEHYFVIGCQRHSALAGTPTCPARPSWVPPRPSRLMVEPFLAVANFLLPHSTAASSRPLLALNTLIPRLSLSLASFQADMSRAHSSTGKRKGKAALGDDHHALFEHSDWLHVSQRKSSVLIYGQFHADISFLSSIQTAPFTALAAFGPRATVHTPLRPAPSLSPRPQSTLHPASGKANMYGISAAKHRQCGTATLARPTTYHLPP